MTRINTSALRARFLSALAAQRPHLAGKKRRFAPTFFIRANAVAREAADAALNTWIQKEIETMPSTGKTIR